MLLSFMPANSYDEQVCWKRREQTAYQAQSQDQARKGGGFVIHP
jgi:hypothetical protein